MAKVNGPWGTSSSTNEPKGKSKYITKEEVQRMLHKEIKQVKKGIEEIKYKLNTNRLVILDGTKE